MTGFVQRGLIKDLLKECAKMYEFDHPNVLKLSGVCLDGGPAPYIIMPFMENGSLLSYLKEERETVVLDLKSASSEDVVSIIITILIVIIIIINCFNSHAGFGREEIN